MYTDILPAYQTTWKMKTMHKKEFGRENNAVKNFLAVNRKITTEYPDAFLEFQLGNYPLAVG